MIGGITQRAIRPDGQDGHIASAIIGDEDVLSLRIDAKVGGSGSFRADNVQERQVPGCGIDTEGADGSGGHRPLQHTNRANDMVQQRFQVPPGARRGTRQELRSNKRGLSECVTDGSAKQLLFPAQSAHGDTAGLRAGISSPLRYVCGRPNDSNRSALTKLTIRAIPVRATVGTSTAWAWYAPSGSSW